MAAEAHESVRETQPFARRVVREEVNRELGNHGLPTLEEQEDLDEEEAEEIAAGLQVDVFDYCHPLVENGQVVSYTIYKNSEMLVTKPHPYSWDKLQDELGEGHYRVVAKSQITKKILKQQTAFIAAKPVREEKVSVAEQIRANIPPPLDPMDQFAKFAAVMKSINPERPPAAPAEKDNSSLEMMKLMIEMNKTSQDSTNRLIEKMQDSTTKMIEKISSENKEMIARLETKISGGPAKEKGLGSMELIALLQSAEKKGMETWMKLEEMADRKAAKMSGKDNEEEGEPKSAIERLAAAVIPGVMAAMSKQSDVPPAQTSGAPIQRRRPIQQVQAVPNPPPPQAPRPGTTVVLPRVSKEQAINHLIPIVLPHLAKADSVKTDPKAVAQTQSEAAQAVKIEMSKAGITVQALLQLVGQGDIIDVATQYRLPLEAHTWIKGFYADLTKLGTPKSGPTAPAQTAPVNTVHPIPTPQPASGNGGNVSPRVPDPSKPAEPVGDPNKSSSEPGNA